MNNETSLPNFKINDDPIMNSRVVSRKASEGSYLQQKHRKASRRGPYSADCTPESRRSSCATPHRFPANVPTKPGWKLLLLVGKFPQQHLRVDANHPCWQPPRMANSRSSRSQQSCLFLGRGSLGLANGKIFPESKSFCFFRLSLSIFPQTCVNLQTYMSQKSTCRGSLSPQPFTATQ